MKPPRASFSWTDTHCHLQDLSDDRASIELAEKLGVRHLICVGTDEASSRRSIELARMHSAEKKALVWASVGLHPHQAVEGTEAIGALLEELEDERVEGKFLPGSVVAVGECGLDYYYEHSPRNAQRQAFAAQIGFAKAHDLALVVHTRDAWSDTIAIFNSEGMPSRTVIHCFSGGPAEAEKVLALGAYISISGIVTFKNAEALRQAAALVPPERLLVETDSPFLAPVPHRGHPNEPGYVAVVGEALANLRQETPAALARSTSSNAARVFLLKI